MSWPDIVNGFFELFAGALLLLNVCRLRRDKVVRGVSILPVAFFTLWGFWNLYYYPQLGQWMSLIGGLAVVSVNFLWVCLALWYSRKKHS